MINIGQFNTLTITRFTDHGAYVDGGEVGEILVPKAYVTKSMRPGDTLDLFVYLTNRNVWSLLRNSRLPRWEILPTWKFRG